MHTITLYTKKDCKLCDASKHTIDNIVGQRVVALVQIVDITSDPALHEKYRHEIPVIFVDGVERFRHTLDPDQLAKLLLDEPGESLLGLS